jgi:RND family efflux transporter MFP subunit
MPLPACAKFVPCIATKEICGLAHFGFLPDHRGPEFEFSLEDPMKQDSPVTNTTQRRGLLRPVLALVLMAGLAAAGWRLLQPQTVTVVKPVRGPAIQAVYATGTVEASITIRVAPQVAGRLFELLADEGQAVKAGDVLARLDDSDVRATVSELEAREGFATQQFGRVSILMEKGWAARERFDQARTEMDAARQAHRRARELLRFLQLKTPADGTIIRRDGEVGDFIPVNQPVFYLAKAGVPLRITADVDEEDIPLVRVGQKVLIRSDAFPSRVFTGEVNEITPKGDPVARNFRVRIELPADTALLIGMTAETNIVTAEKQDALMIPASAAVGGSVWVVRGGRLESVPVRIGIKGRERIEAVSGLSEDDLAVAQPAKGLKAGEAVRIHLSDVAPAQEIKR